MDTVDKLKEQIKLFLRETDHPITLDSMRTCLNFLTENAAIMLLDYEKEIYRRIITKGR